MHVRTTALTSTVAVALAVFTACAPSDASPPVDDAPSLEASATEAREAGASEEQVAVLESGEIAFEDYEAAMNRAYACMRDAGVTVDVVGVRSYHGVTVLDATMVAPEGGDAVVDECYLEHARYVDAYWQVSSPDAVAYDERRATALKPLLRDCLTQRDVDWPADASFDELARLALDPGASAEENCLDAVGYSTWDG